MSCGSSLAELPLGGLCPKCATPIAKSIPACPRCFASGGKYNPLVLQRDATFRTWRCTCCGGMAFEKGQLAQGIEQIRAGVRARVLLRPEPDAERPVRCLRCDLPMTNLRISNRVVIDRCGSCCQYWLDAGEFPAVASFVARTLKEAPLPSDTESILGDPAQIREWATKSGSGGSRRAMAAILHVLVHLLPV